MHKALVLLFFSASFLAISCKKDSYDNSPDAQVYFSTDTLKFDTVFTSTGSVRGTIKLTNGSNQKLMLSSLRLMGGSQSPFKINIDGAPGPASDNIEMDANDSLYIFVSVFIDPGADSLPFVLQDSIAVSYNGVNKYVQLQAYGQNAHFLNNISINSNTIWANDLPYVILGGLHVAANSVLVIQQGCRIYAHANAPVLVDGSLQVLGDSNTRVSFQGDRLDYPYSSYPGSWPGIFYNTSSYDNLLSFASVNNAYQGVIVQDPSVNANPKLRIHECIFNNIYDAGILGLNSNIEARNCLLSNNGKNIELQAGGTYQFVNCTAASYSNQYITHQLPVLQLSNFYEYPSGSAVNDLNASFTNCIFWGDSGIVADEVLSSPVSGAAFNANLTNCLIRSKDPLTNINAVNNILNADPLFMLVNNQTMHYDFHLQSGSAAIAAGVNTGLSLDLDGSPRPAGAPDIGCYQKQP